MSNESDRIDHLVEMPGVYASELEGLLAIRKHDFPELSREVDTPEG